MIPTAFLAADSNAEDHSLDGIGLEQIDARQDGTRTGGEILIDQLAIHGVRHVFCVRARAISRARCLP